MNHIRCLWRRSLIDLNLPGTWLIQRSFSVTPKPATDKSTRRPTRSLIDKYWSLVVQRTTAMASPSPMQPIKTATQDNPSQSKHLIASLLRVQRDQGDLWPSLLAQETVDFYSSLSTPEKQVFLSILAQDFGLDSDGIKETARRVGEATDAVTGRSLKALSASMTAPYSLFLDRIYQLPDGLSFLVRMRQDLLALLKTTREAPLRDLEETLKSKLSAWFSVGSLELARLAWDSPASLLEKVMQYEAVHAIPDWEAMKQRVAGPGRMCFAYLHRGMPLVPLTFIQIALTNSITSNISNILSPSISPQPLITKQDDPSVAVFYSITSSQPGLSGIDLGNFLIKRVVRELIRDVPSVKTFCTLSPIPGFRQWLEAELERSPETVFLPREVEALQGLFDSIPNADAVSLFGKAVSQQDNPNVEPVLKPILVRLCARYIFQAKRRGLALDPVTNFHIRNGAVVYRLNWAGDLSPKGLSQSYGLMINYMYLLDQVEENNAAYLLDGRIGVHPEYVLVQTE